MLWVYDHYKLFFSFSEVVGRDSETQLQVGENLNLLNLAP